MPKTAQEINERPYIFKFGEEAAALIYLLRAADATTFRKYCPDIENHGSITGADDIILSMFRALHGAVIATLDELPEEGTKSEKFCAAYALAAKVGRPRREVVINEMAEERAAEIIQEKRRLQINAQERQRHASKPAGLEAKAHVGGFTTRGTRVEPAKAAAIVEVRKGMYCVSGHAKLWMAPTAFSMICAGDAVLELA